MNNENEVTPINEVKIEEITTNEANSNATNQPSNNKPPKSSKLSTILLILLFVFMFAYIMGMPYINGFIEDLKNNNELSQIEQDAIEEEKKQQHENNKPTPTPEVEKVTEVTCTSNINTIDSYTLIQTQKFSYNSKNEILSSNNIFKYTFTIEDETYNTLKKQCEEDSLKYITHEGYTMACSHDGLNIEISHEFDLEIFKPIVDETTNIQANATYKQNIGTIKNTLIGQGYTCE